MEFLFDADVQNTLSRLTVVGLLVSFILITGWLLLKKRVVFGFMYKEKEEDLKKAREHIDKLQDRIEMLEAYAWRGTHIAKRGVDTAEYYAHRERPPHDPQG